MSDQSGFSHLKDFEKIYKDHYALVASIVQKFKITDAAADDIIQDTFIQAWKNLATLKNPEAFRGWLSTIARNNCLKVLSKAKQNKNLSMTTEEDYEVVLVADDDYASFQFEHKSHLLTELITAHKGEPRASVAKMFYLEGRSIKEICGLLDLKQNTALSHLRRFRLMVSKAMLELAEEKGLEFR